MYNNKKYSKIYYNEHKEKFKEYHIKHKRKNNETSKKWHEKNKEYHNQYKRKYYKENKYIWKRNFQLNKHKIYSRRISFYLLINHPELLEKKCKNCLTTQKLEIHHEIYPLTVEETRNAIKQNKIYFICLTCHKRIHKKK